MSGLGLIAILWKNDHAIKSSSVIGKWDSAFYSMAPTTFLTIKPDGSFTYEKEGGTWHVSGEDYVFESTGKMGTMTLHYEQDGRMLGDGYAHGISFVRDSTLKFEEDIVGRWSTSKNPVADAKGAEVVLIEQGFNYSHGDSKGKYETGLDTLSLTGFMGNVIVLSLSNDKNSLIKEGTTEPFLTRIPVAPLEKAVLGKWSYSLEVFGTFYPTEFLPNGTIAIKGKKKKWRVKNDKIVIEKIVNDEDVELRLDNNAMRITDSKEMHSIVLIRTVY